MHPSEPGGARPLHLSAALNSTPLDLNPAPYTTPSDSIFLFATDEPVRVSVTTCNTRTSFPTSILLFDGLPTEPENNLLATSVDDGGCSVLFYDLALAGAYYILTEGLEVRLGTINEPTSPIEHQQPD
jgi:hypothetical protein